MIYLKFTNVDAVTGVPVCDAPAANGPALPDVPELKFGFALESQYPTDKPLMYGTAPDTTDLSTPGILERVQQSAYDTAMLDELAARGSLAKAQTAARITAARYAKETAGFQWQGFTIATDAESSAKIRAEREAGKDGRRKDTDVWKCIDTATGQTVYRVTTNDEMVSIGDTAYFRTQACYAREAELMAALADGTLVPEMIGEGWPA